MENTLCENTYAAIPEREARALSALFPIGRKGRCRRKKTLVTQREKEHRFCFLKAYDEFFSPDYTLKTQTG